MAKLNIGGQKVTVGDDFLSLSPEQQNATVDEIAGSIAGQSVDIGKVIFGGGEKKPAEDVTAGMALRGIPVLGAYVPQAEAAIRAAAQPFTGVGQPGETWRERYEANLPEQQAQYAQAEQESPITSGALKLGGGMAALAPLGATAAGARALGVTGSLPARIAASGASGAALSAADTAARGGNMEDVTEAAKWGVGIGAATPVVASTVRRAISPFMSRDPVRAQRVATLQAEGYQPTVGEVTGSRPLQWMEQHYGELGGANKIPQSEKLGAAAWKRAGQSETRVTPEAVDRAFTKLGNEFDGLAARNTLAGDNELTARLGQSLGDYMSLVSPPNRVPAVNNYLKEIKTVLTGHGNTIPGKAYRSLASRLEATARNLQGNPQTQAAADALRGFKGAIDDAMERSMKAAKSPDLGAWKKVRGNYRNLLVLEKVATNPRVQNGIVTPAALYSATKQVQGIRNMARGRGDMQPLAQAASDILRDLPSSGTAQRTFYQSIPNALAGAGVGAIYGQGDPWSAIGGGALGVMGAPLAGRALMSRPVQGYLGNQLMAGPGGRMLEGATLGGLLGLSGMQ